MRLRVGFHKVIVEGGLSFREVFSRYFSQLCFFADKFVPTYVTEDLVQDVFLRLWSTEATFDTEKSLRIYLYVAVRNACLDYLKKESNRQKYVNTKISIEKENPTFFINELLKEETHHILEEAIASLPEKSGIIMSYVARGYGNKEIAEKLQVSVNTVKTHKLIAYKKLKVWFGEQFPGVSTEDLLSVFAITFPFF